MPEPFVSRVRAALSGRTRERGNVQSLAANIHLGQRPRLEARAAYPRTSAVRGRNQRRPLNVDLRRSTTGDGCCASGPDVASEICRQGAPGGRRRIRVAPASLYAVGVCVNRIDTGDSWTNSAGKAILATLCNPAARFCALVFVRLFFACSGLISAC